MNSITAEQYFEIGKSYLDFGFSIIPIGADKKPLIKWIEYQKRQATVDELIQWIEFPNLQGFAVVTGEISGVFVLDCDAGYNLADFETPPSITVKTGSGTHIYFRYPEAYRITNTTGLLPHVDIRGEGGYAILPPSLHSTGVRYEWINDLTTPLTDAPEWLLNLIKDKTGGENSNALVGEIVLGVDEGSRNDSASRLIGMLLAYQPTKYWHPIVWPLIQAWNETNNPPLSNAELLTTFRSIEKSELTKRKDPSHGQTIYPYDQVTEPQFETVSFSELMDRHFSNDIWLVEHLILENGINCIAGKPKSGKSFIVLQMAKNIAEGKPVFGKYQTKQSNILLITKEDSLRLLKMRLVNFEANKDLPISFSIEEDIYLDTDQYLNSIIQKCTDLNAKVVIFDSFRRFLKGDENSSEDVSKLHRFFKHLNDSGITVIFNHHFRKGNGVSTDSFRGSSDIHAMVDSAMVLEFDKELNIIQITQNACREAEEQKPFSVSFPRFVGVDREFKIANATIQIQKSAKDQAVDDVLAFIQTQTEPVYQKIISDALVNQNSAYQTTYVKKALERLILAGRIVPSKHGNKTFYQVSERSSLGQTFNDSAEVTDETV